MTNLIMSFKERVIIMETLSITGLVIRCKLCNNILRVCGAVSQCAVIKISHNAKVPAAEFVGPPLKTVPSVEYSSPDHCENHMRCPWS